MGFYRPNASILFLVGMVILLNVATSRLVTARAHTSQSGWFFPQLKSLHTTSDPSSLHFISGAKLPMSTCQASSHFQLQGKQKTVFRKSSMSQWSLVQKVCSWRVRSLQTSCLPKWWLIHKRWRTFTINWKQQWWSHRWTMTTCAKSWRPSMMPKNGTPKLRYGL